MSQCQKRRYTEAGARQAAEMLELRNKLENHPRPEAYAYPCLLCRGHWHVTSQPYHIIKKEEANEHLAAGPRPGASTTRMGGEGQPAMRTRVAHKGLLPVLAEKPAEAVTDIEDEDEGHDCINEIESNGMGGYHCGVCGDPLDVRDAECNYCGYFPCHCDEAYERLKEDRLERGY